MTNISKWLFLLLPILLPANTFAASHRAEIHNHHSGQEQRPTMQVEKPMYIIGDETVEGVRGMAHLKDLGDSVATGGSNSTHHFMVAFINQQSGEIIEQGVVSLKIESPEGTVKGPVTLENMQKHFGAGIVLEKTGEYRLLVDAELPGGVSRSFVFHYEVR